MHVIFRLCRMIVRKNKGFTAGIFFMSLLSVAIAFLGANFGASSSDTLYGFFEDARMPDTVYQTEILPPLLDEWILAVDGVDTVSHRLSVDCTMETAEGEVYPVRVIRFDEKSAINQTVHAACDTDESVPTVLLSHRFAEQNGISPADEIEVRTPLGSAAVTVGAIVSNPETMDCVKDKMSAYEGDRFGYLYISEEELDKIVTLNGLSNEWLVTYRDGLTEEERADCRKEIRAALEDFILSETDVADSAAMKSLGDDLHTISVLCTFIPGIIWLISLGFTFLFIRIIIENRRQTIGLLRALGYSVGKTVGVFALYTVLINIPALLCGVPLGCLLLKVSLGALAASSGIIKTAFTVRYFATVFMVLGIFAVGIAAALCSTRTVARIDPSDAYEGAQQSAADPPRLLRVMRGSTFFKISMIPVIRGIRRQIVGALCITACVICISVGLEGVLSIGHPIEAVFGGRYRYDLLVRGIGERNCREISEGTDGIDRMETAVFFTAQAFGEEVRVSSLAEDAELVVLTDADGSRLLPGSGVIIDEMRAKISGISVGDRILLDEIELPVTGIAREILYPVYFVSPGTAERFGYSEPNAAFLRLAPGYDQKTAEKKISEIAQDAYVTEFSAQKENIKNGFYTMRMIMLMFALLAFVIGSLIVVNITIIDFQENRRRYATLRALGTPTRKLCGIAAAQNTFRVLLGDLLACPLCCVSVSVLLKLLSGPSKQYVMVGFGPCLLASCLLPVFYVLFGVCVSLYRVRRMDFCGYLNEME